MAITGDERYELHKYFEESMGRRLAANLMELLPPAGWGDVATKQDLAHQRELIDEQFKHTWAVMATTTDIGKVRTDIEKVRTDVEKVRTHIEVLRTELHKALRLHLAAIVAVIVAFANVMR